VGVLKLPRGGVAPWLIIGVDERRRLVAAGPRNSLIVIGEPGVGKSTGLIQPNSFPEFAGPTLVRSTRTDNRDRVVAANVAAGRESYCLDLDGTGALPPGCAALRVSLLDLASTWTKAREVGLRLMRSVREPGVSLQGADAAFEGYGADLTGALLLAAHRGRRSGMGLTLVAASTWLADLRAGVPTDDALAVCRMLLERDDDLDGRHALGGIENVADWRSNRQDTIQKVGDALGHLLVGAPLDALAAADRSGSTSLDHLVATGAILYIVVSDDNPARARSHGALSSLVEDELVAAAKRHWRTGTATGPLRLLYDESATGSVNPNIPAWAATGGGDGIAVLLCTQSLSQLDRVFPNEGAGLIDVFNHRLFLRGHALDGERIAPMFGEVEVEVEDRGWSRPTFGTTTRSRGRRIERRPRVTPDDLVQIPNGYGYLASRDHVGRVRLLPSYGDPWVTRYPR